ncbi:MAG: hypothetical protein KJO69_09975 [Gammaproteobacteria bacterium]|nr:hypothetical protein [Gammaproteobacteria bacterium]
MSLLTIVQRFAEEVNVNSPSTVMGTTDPQIKQIKALLQKEGDDLSRRGDWEVLVNEAIHTTGINGTTTLTITDGLIDNTATFTDGLIQVGNTVTNKDTSVTSTVTSINNDTYLSLADDIFQGLSAGENYGINVEDQGSIDSIATNGFNYIRNDTIWDRSLRLPVYVIDATDWQQVKAVAVTGPRYQARLRGGNLLVNPIPTAGNTWAFEYVTKNWMTDSTGATNKQYFTNDGDLPLLPETVLEAGLQWRWKKQKGLEYSEDFRTYEIMVADALSRNGLKRAVNLSQTNATPQPKIYTPEGNWNL